MEAKEPSEQLKNAIEMFLGESKEEYLSPENQTVLEHLFQLEEMMVSEFSSQTLSVDPFAEQLDFRKAELVWERDPLPLPEYLRQYVNLHLLEEEPKDRGFLSLTKQGMQAFGTWLDPKAWTIQTNLAPSLRNAGIQADALNHNSVIFEETTRENQKFFYQIVKENDEEVYLSVKADGKHPFLQVNLKRDGRFILSSKINAEGLANFSGILPGKYTIEFLGPEHSKSFDLSILLG